MNIALPFSLGNLGQAPELLGPIFLAEEKQKTSPACHIGDWGDEAAF